MCAPTPVLVSSRSAVRLGINPNTRQVGGECMRNTKSPHGALAGRGVASLVIVAAQVAALQADRAEVRAEIVSKQLTDLPVPMGRNYQQFFRVLPGFRPPTNAGSVPANPTRALVFNVNGVSSKVNSSRVDGA